MTTTNSAFVKKTNATLSGTSVGAALDVLALNPANANALNAAGNVTRLDGSPNTDLSSAGYAKNGCARFALTGTTAVTLTLADLTSTTTSSAGDTSFSTVNQLVIKAGAADVTMGVGGSNPFPWGYGGTSPTMTIPANSRVCIESAAGITVDSTHKTILFTPTAGGEITIAVGGA